MLPAKKAIFVWDFGPVSSATRGSNYPWPRLENWLPPFNHFCPDC